MALTNDVRLIGYIAEKPKLCEANGKRMLAMVLYTHDYMGKRGYVAQPHRCLAFGRIAELIARKGDKGKHVYVRGMLHNRQVGEGDERRYYTNIIVEDVYFTPVQGFKAFEGLVREVMGKDINEKMDD